MRAKSVLLLIIALGCGVVASVAVSQVILEQKGTTEQVELVGVLVVAKDISPMSKIAPESFRVEQWPRDRIPLGALTDPKLIEGKYTKQRLYQGEAIIEAKLSAKGKDIIIPEGYRVFDLSLQEGNGSQGYIGPGDRVDVKGFFAKGTRFPVSKSVTVMENVEVLMVDGVAFRDPDAAAKSIRTVQLLVKDSQYEALDTAWNLGKLRVALRPPASSVSANDGADNGEQFLNWLKANEATNKTETASRAEADSFFDSTPVAPKRAPEQHDMVFYTPNGTTIYRWIEGRSTPEKITTTGGENASSSANSEAPSFPPPRTKPVGAKSNGANASGEPASTNDSTTSEGSEPDTAAPVDPEDSKAPGLTWDSIKGVWQSGGFKAIYPNSK